MRLNQGSYLGEFGIESKTGAVVCDLSFSRAVHLEGLDAFCLNKDKNNNWILQPSDLDNCYILWCNLLDAKGCNWCIKHRFIWDSCSGLTLKLHMCLFSFSPPLSPLPPLLLNLLLLLLVGVHSDISPFQVDLVGSLLQQLLGVLLGTNTTI